MVEDNGVELRGDIPRDLMDLIDAVVLSRGGKERGVFRIHVVEEVLQEWAKHKHREAILITRVTRRNGHPGASAGRLSENQGRDGEIE